MDSFTKRSILFAFVLVSAVAVARGVSESGLPTESFSSDKGSVHAFLAADIGPQAGSVNTVKRVDSTVSRAVAVPDSRLTASVADALSNLENKNAEPAKPVLQPLPVAAVSVPVAMPEISSAVILAKYLDDNSVLMEKARSARWPVASITKLMTAVVAKNLYVQNQEIVITESAAATEGESGFLKSGESYYLEDLIKAMLVVSSNDAAAAIAEFYDANPLRPGYSFSDLMQEKAAELGMRDTTFADATGLSFLNQSNSGDLEILITHVLKTFPDLLEVSRAGQVNITERRTGAAKTLVNINAFAGKPGFIGGKTGFIDASGGNLLSLFSVRGRQLLVVVLGSSDRFGDSQKIFDWVKNQ